MAKFGKTSHAELLGVTDVCLISDEEIWQHLVSPMTRALLGPIVETRPIKVVEASVPQFEGDNVTNLNDHRLYGGRSDFIRFPYTLSFYKTVNGAFIVKRDGVKFEMICLFGDVDKGKGELILKAGMKDRRYDGTKRGNDSSLLDFPYDDPVFNRPLSPDFKSVELSIYAYMPGSRLVEATGDEDYENFVRQPFAYTERPELFLKHFDMAWRSRRAPGQPAAPIPDVAGMFIKGFETLAIKYGYDFSEMAPSHFHVAKWGLTAGYAFVDPTQAAVFEAFRVGLEEIRAAGKPLTRTQQSWVCVIQSLQPADLIPAELRLAGPIWPQDNITKQCLWLFKPLSDRVKDFKPTPYLPQAPAQNQSAAENADQVVPAASSDAGAQTTAK
jgi:hypothetical protein